MISRIGLGTVQFGQHYGITNNRGKPSRRECTRIIDTALDAGIVYYDTAAYYGDADLILASALPAQGCRVVTKVQSPSQVLLSADIFGENLYGILSDGISGMGVRTGISVYWPTAADTSVQLVQLPLNIADTRNLKLASVYKSCGAEIHARSIFLQGLLLEQGATIRQCLKFVLAQPTVDVAIIGCNSVAELKQIIAAVETLDEESGDPIVPRIPKNMLDPRTWSSHANH